MKNSNKWLIEFFFYLASKIDMIESFHFKLIEMNYCDKNLGGEVHTNNQTKHKILLRYFLLNNVYIFHCPFKVGGISSISISKTQKNVIKVEGQEP